MKALECLLGFGCSFSKAKKFIGQTGLQMMNDDEEE